MTFQKSIGKCPRARTKKKLLFLPCSVLQDAQALRPTSHYQLNKLKLASHDLPRSMPLRCNCAQTDKSLRSHLISANAKRHRCPVTTCGSSFTRHQDLKRHQAELHKLGGSVYKCPAAGCKTYNRRKDNFKRHVKRCHPLLMGEIMGV